MTVFITQEVRGRNFADALSFGSLEVLLPALEQATLSTQPVVRRMLSKLNKFTDEDYLLFSGDPVAIAVAAALAAQFNRGRFRLLKWDRQANRYLPLQVDLSMKKGTEGGF